MTNEKHDEVSGLINIVEGEGFGKASLEKQLEAIRKLGFTNDNRALEYLNGLAEETVMDKEGSWSPSVFIGGSGILELGILEHTIQKLKEHYFLL